jgi:hypothetical protein
MTPSEARTAEEVAREIVSKAQPFFSGSITDDAEKRGSLLEAIASALRSRDDEITEYKRRSELNPLSGYSCNGVNVWGDETSMKAVRSAFHEAGFYKACTEELRNRTKTAESEVTRLSARCEALEKALEPFARVAEHDIGTDEDDSDIFRMMSANNRAPLLTVGDLRRARALTEGNKP